MRAASRLFVHHEHPEQSHFTLIYSDDSAVRASLRPAEGTEGLGLEDLALVPGSLVPGRCETWAEGLRLRLDDGRAIELRDGATGWTSDDGLTTLALGNKLLVEEFSRRFCRPAGDQPAAHDYDTLAHARPELAKKFLVSWFLGNPCNFACSYCPSWLHDGTQPWRDYDVVQAFCDRLIEQLPADRTLVVEFNGGEVTLWKDYARLCGYLKSRGVVVSMITNGTRPIAWWQEHAASFDIVQLSYHTEFARRDDFLTLCEFLRDKVDLRVYVMMPPSRLELCLEVATAIAARGVAVNLKPITDDLLGEMVPGYTEQALARLNAFNKTVGLPAAGTASRSFTVPVRGDMVKQRAGADLGPVHLTELISHRENGWLGWTCFSGPEQIVIDGSGYVYRGWCKVGPPLGHVGEGSFRFAADPIVCDKELCNCPFDMFSTKTRRAASPA